MEALARVPRHAFVRQGDTASAYVNRPQSIGHGQTISQPYIVALMTELLDLGGDDRVLEIGTGSGYQSAVLAELAGRVFSVEVVEALAADARRRLRDLGYDNIDVRTGDGYAGWPERMPFDAIIVTAAPERIPETLVDQLRPGWAHGRPHWPGPRSPVPLPRRQGCRRPLRGPEDPAPWPSSPWSTRTRKWARPWTHDGRLVKPAIMSAHP